MFDNHVDFTDTSYNQTFSNFSFRSGMLKCGVSFQSINKGQQCSFYTNCTVSRNGNIVSGRYAECGCSYDASGQATCGIMNGDTEFNNYRQSFVKYFANTKYCHVSRGFNYDCGDMPDYTNL